MLFSIETTLIICDLEATCWRGKAPVRSEIIEIGAVALRVPDARLDEFQTFIKPVETEMLSDFCTELTSITQSDVEDAPLFPEAFASFLEWMRGFREPLLASWGNYDWQQLRRDCESHGVEFPFDHHLNIKTAFAKLRNERPQGMKGALRRVELALEGTHHRGIDDARNIAALATYLIETYGWPVIATEIQERLIS